MTQLSLKDRLARLLKEHFSGRWIASGDLQRIVAAKTDYTPQNVGRRLRELENEKVVEVKYVKGHAHYRFCAEESIENRRLRSLKWFEELPQRSGLTTA